MFWKALVFFNSEEERQYLSINVFIRSQYKLSRTSFITSEQKPPFVRKIKIPLTRLSPEEVHRIHSTGKQNSRTEAEFTSQSCRVDKLSTTIFLFFRTADRFERKFIYKLNPASFFQEVHDCIARQVGRSDWKILFRSSYSSRKLFISMFHSEGEQLNEFWSLNQSINLEIVK